MRAANMTVKPLFKAIVMRLVCTPEYVAGCGMYDPNRGAKNGSMGRWSGVVFRNLAAISLDAYTGEKWNVQHKDVRITQLCSDGPYVPGDTRVVFDALPAHAAIY